jgi:hypothetical protein
MSTAGQWNGEHLGERMCPQPASSVVLQLLCVGFASAIDGMLSLLKLPRHPRRRLPPLFPPIEHPAAMSDSKI